MRIDKNALIMSDGQTIMLPKHAVASRVALWRVPTMYRSNGLFVSITIPGTPEQIPACNLADCTLLGELDYPADAGAVLDRARAQRLATARAAVDAAARALVAHISSTEQQTWPTQLAEAQLVNSWRDIPDRLPPPSYYPLLALMATQRGYGESVFQLADRVIAAAGQYTAAAGPLVAWGQRTERALNAAQTMAELNAISLTPPAQSPASAPEPVASQQ